MKIDNTKAPKKRKCSCIVKPWVAVVAAIVITIIGVLVIIFMGIPYLLKDSERETSIKLYNSRVAVWQTVYQKSFDATGLTMNGNYLLRSILDAGTNKIVADSCQYMGDPSEECRKAISISYKGSIMTSSDSNTVFTLSDESNRAIGTWVKKPMITEVYNSSMMNCKYNCASLCNDLKGRYVSEHCFVNKYLTSVCIRMQTLNSLLAVDSTERDLSYNDNGCYYSNRYDPFYYETRDEMPTSIEVEIRHYMDPVISASEYTKGCSDSHYSSGIDKKCFGYTRFETILYGLLIIVAVSLCTLIIDIVILPRKRKAKNNLSGVLILHVKGKAPTAPIPVEPSDIFV